jgi:DNA-binding NtrC family response regulator
MAMARILVVDDEESIVYTFESFLADEGHEVLVARSYDEAVRQIGGDVDLIFCDIILGGKTGIDLLGEVRARGLVSPVVVITGFPLARTAAEAVRLGAFDYVTKPVVQDTLLHLTRTALQRKRALDECEQYRLRLEATFSSVEDAIVTVDTGMRVLDVNAAATDLCGLGPAAIGRRMHDTGAPCAGLVEALEETLRVSRPVRARRVEWRRPGYHGRVLSVSTNLLVDAESRLLGAVMVVRGETRHAELARGPGGDRRLHAMLGKSEAMQKVHALIETLADVDSSVLITGESGTGKELAAEALHHLGARKAGPLVKVNCSALPENLLESELFGHAKGAFTGATGDRIGRFQRADGGTILLDEIGDISRRTQLSLLRVLQEKEFERVGDSRPMRVDVRVLASTNRDLGAMVRRGEFREDLYYRLKVVEVVLPPLRERREDIPLLTACFIARLNQKLGRKVSGLSADVERLFMDYAWPGNVRELAHVVEHAMVLCGEQETICMHHLSPELFPVCRSAAVAPVTTRAGGDLSHEAIQGVLRRTDGNKAKAARLLGIDRKTLYRRMARSGIHGDASA